METKKEQAEVLKRIMSNTPQPNTVYSDAGAGVYAYVKSLNDTENTTIRDFYKPTKVKQAVESVDVSKYDKQLKNNNHAEVKQDGNEVRIKADMSKAEYISNEDIKAKLLKHPKAIKEYYNSLATPLGFLTKTTYHVIPPHNSDDYKAMASCFEPKNDVFAGAKETEVVAWGWVVKKDKVKTLYELIKKQPQATSHRINVMYEADTPATITLKGLKGEDDIPLKATFSENRLDRFGRLADLTEKCGIQPEGMTYYTLETDGVKRVITDAHFIVEHILTDALAFMLAQHNYDLNESGEVSNLIGGQEHSFALRPVNMSLTEAFRVAVFDEKGEFSTIFKKFRNAHELGEASGLHLSVAQQSVLPFLTASNDLREFQKKMVLQIPLFYDLILALQDYLRHITPVNGWVKVKDLASFIPRFEHDMKVQGKLRKAYRNVIVDGYQMLKLFEIPLEQETKKNGNKIYKYFKFIKIDEVEVDKRGNVVALKVDFTPEYYDMYSKHVAVILDGIRELDDPQVKLLGANISDHFVSNPASTKKTAENKPLKKKARELVNWAGITDKNHQGRQYQRLASCLDELVKNGKLIKAWENTENHKPEIRGYGQGIGSIDILLYPSDNVANAITTKEMRRNARKQRKADQAQYLKELKKYDKGYQRGRAGREQEAKDLGITLGELENMLNGTTPITDAVIEKVEDEISDKKRSSGGNNE